MADLRRSALARSPQMWRVIDWLRKSMFGASVEIFL